MSAKTKAIRELLQLIDDGILVRSIECDADPVAFIRRGRLINAIKAAQDAIADAPEEPTAQLREVKAQLRGDA